MLNLKEIVMTQFIDKSAVDFFSVHSKEEVTEVDKRIEEQQKKYNAKLRDMMIKIKDFPMTD